MIKKEKITNNFYNLNNSYVVDKQLSNTDFRILSYLHSLHKNFNITQKIISENLSISKNTVEKSIKNLKELGYIDIKEIQLHKYTYILNNLQAKKKAKKQEQDEAGEQEQQKEDEQESKQENNTYSFKLLEKDELKNIYDNIDVYQNKLTTQEKIDFIISLYNQKYTDYISCETIGKDGYNKIIDILNKYTLKDIVYKIKTHLENNKTIENYNGTYQFKYIITNINNIKVKNNVFWERLYFDEDFREIEKNFFI